MEGKEEIEEEEEEEEEVAKEDVRNERHKLTEATRKELPCALMRFADKPSGEKKASTLGVNRVM